MNKNDLKIKKQNIATQDGSQSIRTQVNSYLSQFVLILVNSYELTKMSTN